MSVPIMLRDGVVIPDDVVTRLVMQSDTPHTREWFDALPGVIDDWCARWAITLEPRLPRLTYNVVIFGASRTLGPVVLKMSPPHMEFLAELDGLRLAQGPGIVRLFHADEEEAGMLLERVIPGTPLRDQAEKYDDIAATRIAAASMNHYWRPAPQRGNLIPLDRWFRDLFAYEARLATGNASGPLTLDLTQHAARAAREMLTRGHEEFLLHGDLHHDNLLTNPNGEWTIIDPKGLSGDRAYDVGTWMLNMPWRRDGQDLTEIVRRRVDIFEEELELSRDRIIAGGLVHAVLSACWSLVDGSDEGDDPWLTDSLAVARVLSGLASGSKRQTKSG